MQLCVGTVVEGKVSKITGFGAFVDIDGGGSGMVHISEVANTYVKDILTGSRALSRDFVQSYPLRSDGFEIETEMTIFALTHHFTIKNIPIPYKDRPRGSESKLKTISDGRKILWLIFKEALGK